MTPELINGYWLTTNTHLGTSNTSGVTEHQKTNATNIYNYFTAQGWSLSAIAGMIGNMHTESFLSPAYIEGTNRWRLPNSAANLSDVPNSVMQNFYREYYGDSNRGYGIGLVQWDGLGITRQKLVGFAINNGLNWYDGNTQCLRITDEQTRNIQWTARTLYGTLWTWDNYPTNSRTPEESAHIWRICYEVGGDETDAVRQANARYWYEYFEGGPGPGPGPEPEQGWISGSAFSTLALAYDPNVTGREIPYSEMDCYQFVQAVWRDIPAVSPSDTLCNPASGHTGTNTLWRMNVSPYDSWAFNTTSPDNQTPCPVLWYKDSIANCMSLYGEIPAGALLFHRIGEDDNPQIPSYYRGDGIGNYVHVGIYVGNNQVMQSGGRDSASVPGGGVHLSSYDSSAWNYVAFVVWVDPTGSEPGPGPGPGPEPEPPKKYWLLFLLNKKREVTKNVRYRYSRQL